MPSDLEGFNKSLQFAADGRRTPFPWLLRRHSKVAAELCVKQHEKRSRLLESFCLQQSGMALRPDIKR